MRNLLACAAISSALAFAAAGAPSPAPAAEYSLREGRFALRPPLGWSPSRDAREDARQKVYGVRLLGPRSADGVLSEITLAYYPPDNSLFKGGAAEFLKRNLGGDARIVQPEGETTSPVEKSAVGGLSAQRFTRRTHEYLPPDRADAKEVAVVEDIEVVAAKEGFYVLEFKSSAQLAAKLKPLYARARASVRFAAAD
ncbi:MAG: hypothetical protein ACHQ49_00120 [Elusimicrobiota bacterium]